MAKSEHMLDYSEADRYQENNNTNDNKTASNKNRIVMIIFFVPQGH
jgi:hypothetical protein